MLTLQGILRLTRPLYLLLAALTYALGAGIARYLGKPPVPAVFWLGLAGALLMQISMNLLAQVFRPSSESLIPGEQPAQRRTLRDSALYLSIGSLAALAVVVFILYREDRLPLAALACLGFSLLAAISYAVPPLRLSDKGFGELLLAIQLAYLFPSIGFLLQAGTYHRLLNVTVLPVTFMLLAVLLALDFPSYAEDLKYGRRTLLVRLGWENAVPLHHGLIIAAYILLGVAPLLGFSFGLLWPAFLTLPFAILEVFWLRNIVLGAKPIWSLLTANALAVFGLTAYFLALSFWLR